MFYNFLCSLAKSKYLSIFSLSLIFSLCSTGTAKSTIIITIIIIIIIIIISISSSSSSW